MTLPDESTISYVGLPRALVRLFDFLQRQHGIEIEHIFLETGNHEILEKIQDCFDLNQEMELSEFDDNLVAHSVAEMILRYLDSLPQPLIPFEVYRSALFSTTNQTEAVTKVTTHGLSLPQLSIDNPIVAEASSRTFAISFRLFHQAPLAQKLYPYSCPPR